MTIKCGGGEPIQSRLSKNGDRKQHPRLTASQALFCLVPLFFPPLFNIRRMDYFQPPKVIHTRHQSLRKCCGCVHLRVGAGITCAFWAVKEYRDSHTNSKVHMLTRFTSRGYRYTLQFYHFKTIVVSAIPIDVIVAAIPNMHTTTAAFYSYMESAALVVYGVVNLTLAMIGMLGLGAVYLVSKRYLETIPSD